MNKLINFCLSDVTNGTSHNSGRRLSIVSIYWKSRATRTNSTKTDKDGPDSASARDGAELILPFIVFPGDQLSVRRARGASHVETGLEKKASLNYAARQGPSRAR